MTKAAPTAALHTPAGQRRFWRSFAETAISAVNSPTGSSPISFHGHPPRTYALWRPDTAIRAGDSDGNRSTMGDPSFVTLITAPCFPSHPSAHATASNAARAVLHQLYGNGGHVIRLASPSFPAITLDYTTLKQIADDIDDARVYGGIHFPFDQQAGAEQGRRIGLFVYRNNLCPVGGCQ